MNSKLLILLLLCMTAFGSMAQITANFSFDASKETMCYTEDAGNMPKNDTRIDFRNRSTCAGECVYVWDFGDNSEQIIKPDLTSATHVYTIDGQYEVKLQAINTATIHDSIKQHILHVELEPGTPAVTLAITFLNSKGAHQTSSIQIPDTDYSEYQHVRPITIYSPMVSGENFTYYIQNDDSETKTEPLQSFAHVFAVDTIAFQPFDLNMWTYYWEIFQSDAQGKPTRSIKTAHIDSLRLYYTFSEENFSPGYVVQLKIALDSSKFEYGSDISYYKLEECVASKQQIVPVTDYFFDEASRREENPLDRTAHIPNIFTPGGNDENEVFYFDTNGANVFSVKIFNSWGQLVYSEESTTIRWDGKNSTGSDCPSGVYYYVIQSNEADDRHERGGFIHLFRQ
jgi:gliding motility-associated-like protein